MFVISLPLKSFGQCFEIESILVDACGTPEGENEMVRFSVGATALNSNDLSVTWATGANPWLGICQGANTANITAQLNATITTCGFLKEPIGGVLPANSNVLLITSTDIDVSFNSFDGLNDTLYIIYQCAGNTAGHFGNYNNSGGTRTLEMTFSNPGGCTDIVSYERDLLINQNGIPGGNSALKDGGAVTYTPNGVATYINNGCQAPIIIDTIAITSTPVSICPTDTVNLTAVSSNSNIFWLGGSGVFSNPANLSTDYYSSSLDVFPLTLYVGYAIPCGDTILDSIQITLNSANSVTVTASETSLCDGETITLTASGTGTFEWFDGTTGNTVIIDTAGVFYATTSSSSCGVDTARVTITWNGSPPNVSLSGNNSICQGESTLLTATGDAPFVWSDGSNGSTYTSTSAENIYVAVSNSCGVDTAYLNITISGAPPIATVTGDLTICDNIPTELTAGGGDTYVWSDGTTSINYTSLAGNGYLVANNSCGTDTAYFTIVDLGNSPVASISGNPNICSNVYSVFNAFGGDTYLWSNGASENFITTNIAQDIYVIATNQCGVDTAYLSLIDQNVYADFEMSDSVGYAPLIISFTNYSINSESYEWNFGNDVISNNEDEEITYTSSGNYIVELVAENTYCTDTTTQLVKILNSSSVYIPNSFSPNNDNINDYFLPIVSSIEEEGYSFSIFDRNGGIVFYSTTLGEEWDGTKFGQLLPLDTYIWKLQYKIMGDLNNYEKFGHVNLIR